MYMHLIRRIRLYVTLLYQKRIFFVTALHKKVYACIPETIQNLLIQEANTAKEYGGVRRKEGENVKRKRIKSLFPRIRALLLLRLSP